MTSWQNDRIRDLERQLALVRGRGINHGTPASGYTRVVIDYPTRELTFERENKREPGSWEGSTRITTSTYLHGWGRMVDMISAEDPKPDLETRVENLEAKVYSKPPKRTFPDWYYNVSPERWS